MSGNNATEQEYPDLPLDVHHVQPTDYHTAFLDTTGVRARIDPSEFDNRNIGFTVITDGPYLGLNAGTVGDHGDKLYIYQALEPEQARELADVLYEAAEQTQEVREQEAEPDETPDGWLRRLIQR